jgi:hypothetical protein
MRDNQKQKPESSSQKKRNDGRQQAPFFIGCKKEPKRRTQERIKSWLTAEDAEERGGNLEPGVNSLVIPGRVKRGPGIQWHSNNMQSKL